MSNTLGIHPYNLSMFNNDANYLSSASSQFLNICKIPIVSGTPAASVSIDPYKLYNFGTVNISMTISFDSTKETDGYCAEYMFRFVAGNSCNITLPNAVIYAGGRTPTFTSGHTYEFSITDNLCIVGEFY